MNFNDFIVYDWETSSKFKEKAQPLSLGAVHVDCRRLELGKTFYSKIRPDDRDAVEADALAINKLTLEELDEAPSAEQVFKEFAGYVNSFNYKKSSWGAPIAIGYNILGYDAYITQKLCERFKYVDDRGHQTLFSDFMSIDVMHIIWLFHENNKDLPNLKFDSVRDFLGIPKENAHNSLQDSIDAAKVFTRYLKFFRNSYKKDKFENAFGREMVA